MSSECEQAVLGTDDGYASVEALMAAIVLAGALAFAQAAYIKSRQAAGVGLELRQGRELAGYVMSQPLTATGESVGQTQGFGWRMTLAETGQPGRVAICRRSVRIQSLKTPTRAFQLAGLEPCPPKVAS